MDIGYLLDDAASPAGGRFDAPSALFDPATAARPRGR
jgi:hypothetical protein